MGHFTKNNTLKTNVCIWREKAYYIIKQNFCWNEKTSKNGRSKKAAQILCLLSNCVCVDV